MQTYFSTLKTRCKLSPRNRLLGWRVIWQHIPGPWIWPSIPVQPRCSRTQNHPAIQASQSEELHMDIWCILWHDRAYRCMWRISNCWLSGSFEHVICIPSQIMYKYSCLAEIWCGRFSPYSNSNEFVVAFLQVRDSAQSFLTVQVPLYVSYIYVTAPRGWASLEHHTEMEFSFFYDTVLWRTGTCSFINKPKTSGQTQVQSVLLPDVII